MTTTATSSPTKRRPPTQVSAPAGDPLDEALSLTRRLRLPYLRKAMAEVVPTARAQRWDPAELVRVLLAEEAAGRDEATIRTRRRRAGFPAGKSFDSWDETASAIPRPTQHALATLEWVGRHENLCICGPSGTGKSHFCEALGRRAIDQGMTVAWFSIEDLGALVRRHRADDSVAKAITRIMRADLVTVDDIGLLPISPDAAEGFYRLVDAAYERRALAVSSNLHPSGLDELMPKTLATATVDRLLHHAHIVVTEGDSYRLTEATAGKGVKPLT
jgi:DNA replication protein DnaC